MGRDLLAQDYLLKQLTASLSNPDSEFGKKFWSKVYEQAYQKFGNTNIPAETFNKVWITPKSADIYEKDNTVYIIDQKLKVMMESDYLAMKESATPQASITDNEQTAINKAVMKDVIIPAIEKEVNEGETFAQLRQIYSGMLLAAWYKSALKESILTKTYGNQSKVNGISQDPANNQKIYDQYISSFKKGVVNMLKEDTDKYTNEVIPRKYFSGGAEPVTVTLVEEYRKHSRASLDPNQTETAQGTVDLAQVHFDAAISVLNPNMSTNAEDLKTQAEIPFSEDAAMTSVNLNGVIQENTVEKMRDEIKGKNEYSGFLHKIITWQEARKSSTIATLEISPVEVLKMFSDELQSQLISDIQQDIRVRSDVYLPSMSVLVNVYFLSQERELVGSLETFIQICGRR